MLRTGHRSPHQEQHPRPLAALAVTLTIVLATVLAMVPLSVLAAVPLAGASAATLTTTVTPPTPTAVTAEPGTFTAAVAWEYPADAPEAGSFTITGSPGAVTATVGPQERTGTVNGLTAGVAYTFTVTVHTTGGGLAVSPSSAPVVVAASGGLTRPVRPAVVADTRRGTGMPKSRRGPLAARKAVTLRVAGLAKVPVTATAAVVSVRTQARRSGTLTVAAAGRRAHQITTTFGARGADTTTLTVPVGRAGKVTVTPSQATHLTLTTVGYVSAVRDASGAAGLLHPIASSTARRGAPVRTTRPVAVKVTGRGAVPAGGVSGVLLSVTGKAATKGASVYVYRYGIKRPRTPALTLSGRQSTSTTVLSSVGRPGKVIVAVTGARANVAVAVIGYLTNGRDTSISGGYLRPVAATTLYDTRTRVPAGTVRRVRVAGRGGVPSASATVPATAALLAVRVTAGTRPVSVTAGAGGHTATVPARRTTTTLLLARLVDGVATLRIGGGAARLRADVVGYVSGDLIVATTTQTLTGTQAAATIADVTDTTLTLAAGSTLAREVAVGDVIAADVSGPTPHGLLRKVLAVTTHPDGTVTVTTEQAALTDAIPAGDISLRQQFAPASPTAARTAGSTSLAGPGVRSLAAEAWSREFRASFSETLKDETGEYDLFTASGYASLTPTVEFDMHISPFAEPSGRFFVSAQAEGHLEGEAALPILDLDKTFQVAELSSPTVRFMVGYVPVVFNFEVPVTVHLTGEAALRQHTAVTATFSVGGGVEFSDGRFRPVHQGPEYAFEAPTPRWSADGQLQATFALKPTLVLYGVGGPFLGLRPGARVEVDTAAETCVQVFGLLGVDVGARGSILDQDLGELAATVVDIDIDIPELSKSDCGAIQLDPQTHHIEPGQMLMLNPTREASPDPHFTWEVSAAPQTPGLPTGRLEVRQGTQYPATWYSPDEEGIFLIKITAAPDAFHAEPAELTVTVFSRFPAPTPVNLPDPPTNVHARAGIESAVVSWDAPVHQGVDGDTVHGYTVTAQPGGESTWVPTSELEEGNLRLRVAGLNGGQPYQFTVTATNGDGASNPSRPSEPVTPTGKPQGELITVLSAGALNPGVYLSNFDDSSPTKVPVLAQSAEGARYTVDGKNLIVSYLGTYYRTASGRTPWEDGGLLLVPLDGSPERWLARGPVYDFALSPDGRRAVYEIGQEEGPAAEFVHRLMEVDLVTGAVTAVPGGETLGGPAFAPDGTLIALQHAEGSDECAVEVTPEGQTIERACGWSFGSYNGVETFAGIAQLEIGADGTWLYHDHYGSLMVQPPGTLDEQPTVLWRHPQDESGTEQPRVLRVAFNRAGTHALVLMDDGALNEAGTPAPPAVYLIPLTGGAMERVGELRSSRWGPFGTMR